MLQEEGDFFKTCTPAEMAQAQTETEIGFGGTDPKADPGREEPAVFHGLAEKGKFLQADDQGLGGT